MSEQHKFRYLLPPGNNFAFVRKMKYWLIASFFLMGASVAALFINKAVRGEYMNWTIDFKGGTEMVFAFKDKQTGAYKQVDPATVRRALQKAGDHGVEISDISYEEETAKGTEIVKGMIVKSPRFSALKPEQEKKARDDFVAKFTDREISKASWSGDRLHVRSVQP